MAMNKPTRHFRLTCWRLLYHVDVQKGLDHQDEVDACRHSHLPVEKWDEQKALFPREWAKLIAKRQRRLDWFNQHVIVAGARALGGGLWRFGDQAIIDTTAVNGSAETIGWLAGVTRRLQSGFLYSYAFWMIIGLALLLGWFLLRAIGVGR